MTVIDIEMKPEPHKTLALTVAYNGAGFSGFAKQKDESLRTVQGELERALATLARKEILTVCAGRTDAGVHALGQVVSCEYPVGRLEGMNSHKMLVSLNALTGDDISIKAVRAARDGFSARFDAIEREYRYRIVTGAQPPLFLNDFAWWYKGELDVDAMRAAAPAFIGEQDFKSFCKAASAEGKTTMRHVSTVEIAEDEQLGESHIVIRVIGNAFLHSMVRTMVGTLCEVGRGQRRPDEIASILAARDRGAAGECAPARGLTFHKVIYDEALFSEEIAEI